MRPSDESCGLLSTAVVVVALPLPPRLSDEGNCVAISGEGSSRVVVVASEVSLTFCPEGCTVLKVVVAVVAVVGGPFAVLLIRSAGSVVVAAVVSASEYFA